MNGYKGKVVFTKDLRDGYISVWHDFMAAQAMTGKLTDSIVIAMADVDVTFTDTRAEEIAAIEKRIEDERAASQMRINLMLGKIQELQAISHD